MNTFSLSSLLIIISSILVIVLVLFKGKDRRINKLWASFCVFILIWGIGGYKFSTVSSEESALFWWKFAHIGVIFIPVVFYHFIYAFLDLKSSSQRRFLFLLYGFAFLFLLLNVMPGKRIFVGDLKFVFNQFYWHDWTKYRNPLYLVFYIGFYWVLLGYAFFKIVAKYRHSTGLLRNQLKYFIAMCIMGWLGPEGDYFIVFNIKIYPYTNYLIALYPIIFAYAIIKYRLMDIRVAVTRAGISLLVYSSLLGIPFYLGYQSESWLISTTAAIIFALPAPFIYRYFSVKAENLLLAQQRHYQKILLQAASGMVKEHNLNKLLKLIVYIIKKSVKIKFAAVYFYDRDNRTYILSAKRTSVYAPFNPTIEDDSPLIHYIRRYRVPFLSEEIPHKLRRAFIDHMGTEFDLIVPSIIKDGVQAFLVLGAKMDRSPYTPDDINVFTILSHQGALAIENCVFFEEFRTVQQELFQAEKLASIGGLADGVAHQIKNRLNHFSLASGELKLAIQDFLKKHQQFADDQQCKEIFEYLTKIANSIIENVKRTDDIVKGILNFTRTTEKDTFFGYFSLHAMVETIVSLLLIKHEKEHVPIHILPDSIETIWGVKSQLNEVIYNLLDNAFEATEEMDNVLSEEEKSEYLPEITIKAEDSNEHYRITIVDNGIGIKEEDKPKVFAPFFTTKSSYKSGSGIGMYVARRIVEENHTGTINLESQYMKGVTVTIELPKPQKK